MKVDIRLRKDTLTADLRRALRAAQNPEPALRAGGQVVVEHAKRAFRETGLRAESWPALSAKTLAEKRRAQKSSSVLIRDGHLIRTPRILTSAKRRVIVGSNLFYARFHQLGAKNGIPARPFWPFRSNGKMTEKTARIVRAAMVRRLAVKK